MLQVCSPPGAWRAPARYYLCCSVDVASERIKERTWTHILVAIVCMMIEQGLQINDMYWTNWTNVEVQGAALTAVGCGASNVASAYIAAAVKL